MSRFFGTVLKAATIVFVLLYVSSCLIPLLPAGKFWMFAVLGLVFPILLLILICFVVIWGIARSKWIFLPLVALLLSWQQISVVAGLNTKKEFSVSKSNQTLRIFTWNVSSWGESNRSRIPLPGYWDATTNFIMEQQADVLCFQEFWDRQYPNSKVSNIKIFKELGYPYSYFVNSMHGQEQLKFGVVIFSKYPIIDTGDFNYGKDDFAEHLIYADIQFNRQKVRVFTTHLQSVHFEDEEYIALRKIKQTDEDGLKDSKTIVRKLKYAYQYRGREADFVRQKINESPYPVIICGDFNDVPTSYTYFTIKGDLQDAFLEKGFGLGRTFQYISPTLRIDYILAAKTFNVTQFNRFRVPYSDHYPVTADLQLK